MTAENVFSLPDPPELLRHEIPIMGANDESTSHKVYGRLLGTASGQEDDHKEHPEEYAPKHVQCFACRWTDVYIFDTADDPDSKASYYVLTVGRSDVPGEVDLHRKASVHSAMEILEALHAKQRWGAHVPQAARMAMAGAATYDGQIRAVFMDFIRASDSRRP